MRSTRVTTLILTSGAVFAEVEISGRLRPRNVGGQQLAPRSPDQFCIFSGALLGRAALDDLIVATRSSEGRLLSRSAMVRHLIEAAWAKLAKKGK